jgi:hypothetical protein
MTADELRAIMDYLIERVQLDTREGKRPVVVAFSTPTEEEMVDAGLSPEGAKQIVAVPWWEEMVEDIVETPDLCEPDDIQGRIRRPPIAAPGPRSWRVFFASR